MNGVDYSKKLANEREYFNDTIRKTKETADKVIADNNARNERAEIKQRENFIEDKNDLEKGYQKSLEDLREKTKVAIEEKNNKFNKQLSQERDAFTKDSQIKSKDFDQRLNDIKSSYQKSFESERDNHSNLQETEKKRYARNVNDIRNTTEERLKEYQDKVVGTGSELKDQYKRERHQLSRAHEDNLKQVYKDEANKRSDLKERVAKDIEKSREVSKADMEHLTEYTKDRMNNVEKGYHERLNTMATDYSQRNENLSENQRRENIRQNKEHQDQLMGARRDFNKQLRGLEQERRRADNGSGEYAEVAKAQQGLNDKIVADNKIKQLNRDLKDTQSAFNERRSKDQDAFNEGLKSESTEATARLEKKVNEMNGDKLQTVAKERERARAQIDNRVHQNRLEKQDYERQLMVERNASNDRLKKLKENFNTSMKALEEKGKADIENVSKTSNDDKVEFMKQMTEKRNNEVFAMKREFNRMLDGTVQDYEQRLNKYQAENETLKLTMDQKVSTIMDMADKEVESQRKLFEDRRVADLRSHQLLVDQKENHFKSAINQMNTNYQKKMDAMQTDHDRKLKLLTNDYETKLKDVASSKARELGQKDMNHQMELERIKSAYEEEKARVISQYENQLSAMKVAHSDQLEQMKNFKSLS